MAPTKMAAFTSSKSTLIKYNKLHSKYIQTKQAITESKFQIEKITNTNEHFKRADNTDVPDIIISGSISTNWH
jgi:hypothetical protein